MVKMSKNPYYSSYIGDIEKYFPDRNFNLKADEYYKQCIISAGFKIVDFRIVNTRFTAPCFEEILKSFKGINQTVNRLPVELLDKYYKEYYRSCVEKNFISDLESYTPYSVLIAYVKK